MTEWICGRCYTRLTGETAGVCPACGGEDVIPTASPRGQQIVAASVPQAIAPPPLLIPPPAELPPLNPGVVVCASCYAIRQPRVTGPNSMAQLFLVAFAGLGFVFFWPAGAIVLLVLIIYSVTPTKRLCVECGSDAVVPGDSLRAREILGGRR